MGVVDAVVVGGKSAVTSYCGSQEIKANQTSRLPDLPTPKLSGLASAAPAIPNLSELGAKPPQQPVTPTRVPRSSPAKQPDTSRKVSMDYPEDPWNTPNPSANRPAVPAAVLPERTNGAHEESPAVNGSGLSSGGGLFGSSPTGPLPVRTTSTFTTATGGSGAGAGDARQNTTGMGQTPGGGWDYFAGSPPAGDFNEPPAIGGETTSPFGGTGGGRAPGGEQPARLPSRTLGGSGRTGSSLEESIIVALMPEKEGLFMFQHHNYEVTSSRRGSKVVRRYSDFVWLLDCLQKRYPFRVLPLLPPKRVAGKLRAAFVLAQPTDRATVNGNHLSNDGAFIEKRRRGLARFLNALVRHHVLGQEQLVVMFMTVPTVRLRLWVLPPQR